MILREDGYRQIDLSDVVEGDIVLYQDAAGEIAHIGVVYHKIADVMNASWNVTVLSQWGFDGEYFHEFRDVPQLLGRPTEYWTERRNI